jgi:hypothetical protein
MSYRLLIVVLIKACAAFAMLSGLTSSASASETCHTDSSGVKSCFTYKNIPLDKNTLKPMNEPDPPFKGKLIKKTGGSKTPYNVTRPNAVGN